MIQNKDLVVIDVRNDYFEGGKAELVGSEVAARNVKRILDKFRKDNLPIIYIQHLSVRPDATFFLPQTKGAEFYKAVKPFEEEKNHCNNCRQIFE